MAMIDVCCAFIYCEGRLLAVQRGRHSDHPDQWELPGGKIEPGETASACIQREIFEELQITIVPVGFLFTVEYDYGVKQIRLFPFVAFVDNDQFNLNEHQNARWLSKSELLSPEWQEADRELIRLNEKRILNWFRENDKER